MDSTDRLLDSKLYEFEREGLLAQLQEALQIILAEEQNSPARDKVRRKQGLARWLRFFAALESQIDPNWDSGDVPVTGITPPPVHGVIYPSGIDPAEIPDPDIRAQYEMALKASKVKAERYLFQDQLRRIEQNASTSFVQWLEKHYSSSSMDLKEFEGLLAASQATQARKEWMRKLLHTGMTHE